MADKDRAAQRTVLLAIRNRIDKAGERLKLPPAVSEALWDAWEAMEVAIRELDVDWEQRAEAWNRGEPKGKLDG